MADMKFSLSWRRLYPPLLLLTNLSGLSTIHAHTTQGIYTPSKIDGGHVIAYKNGLSNTTGTLLKGFNESLLSFEEASSAGVLANLNPAQWQELNETVASIAGNNRDVTATRGNTASECRRRLTLLQMLPLRKRLYAGCCCCGSTPCDHCQFCHRNLVGAC